MKYFQRKSRGAAAILVTMLVLAFIATISFIIARVMIQEIRISRDITKSFRAREVAVSGLERGGLEIKNNNLLGGGVTDTLPDGGDYTVKLEDSKLVSVGRFEEAERQLFIDLGSVPIDSIAAGYAHTLALDQGGNVWSWGKNGYGQLGDNSTTPRSTPAKVAGLPTIKSIAAGNAHSLAVDVAGNVWAWGDNQYGQLGNTSVGVISKIPIQVEAGEQGGGSGLVNIKSVSAYGDLDGGNYSLALDNSNNIWAWGDNMAGQLGFGSNTGVDSRKTTPIHVKAGDQLPGPYLSDIKMIVAGSKHSLALDNSNNVWAWGDNIDGQLGVGDWVIRKSPVRVEGGNQGLGPNLINITAIGAGGGHSLAIDNIKQVWSWGRNNFGQLGDDVGFPVNQWLPVQVKDGDQNLGLNLINITSVAGGKNYSLAVDINKNVWGWGSNMNGQLGNGAAGSSEYAPVEVVGGESGEVFLPNINNITAGSAHSLARDTNFSLWAWGKNDNGQLGDGSTDNRNAPVKINIF